MNTILLLCPEPLQARQQGIGIRFLELARTLAAEHRVILQAPSVDLPEPLPFAVDIFREAALPALLAQVTVVVLHGHIGERYFQALERHGLAPGPPLVVDLYDPFLIENLQYTPTLGEGIYYRDRAVLLRQLARGDFFLASSQAQRLFYIGMLVASGRLTPALYHADTTLRRVIDVAPFGVFPPPAPGAGLLRGVVAGIDPEDTVLYFGGVYDWYDPHLLLEALAPVLADTPRLRVVLCANPNPDTTPQQALERLREAAFQRGWLERHVFIIPWFPYDRRGAVYRDVDLAVVLHRPSLETELSLRTRVLDLMNHGVALLATREGEASRLIEASGAGLLVAPGDREGLVQALGHLLADPVPRRAMGEAGQRWVQTHLPWERTLAPLLAFCREPRRLPAGAAPPLPGRGRRLLSYFRHQGGCATLRLITRRLAGWRP